MARNIIVEIGYIGTDYQGFQKQKHTRNTIQTIIEDTLYRVFKERIKVIGASRTDKGVHALAQMIQFEEVKYVEENKYVYILNNELPKDIRAYRAFEGKNGFHVQYSSLKKRYSYKIDNNRVPILTRIPFTLHFPYQLEVERMKEALKTIKGCHDFSAFASRYSEVDNCYRTIFHTELNKYEEGIIEIIIEGDGFLHNMVRIIAGSLLDIGRQTYGTDIFLKAFETKNRKDLGKTAKAKGLTLDRIYYEKEVFK